MSNETVSREEYNKLSEAFEELQQILQSALQGPKLIGTITAGPIDGRYRIDVKGEAQVVECNPQIPEDMKPKINDTVLVIGGLIENILPDGLELKKPLPQFQHIHWDEIGGMKSQLKEIREAVEGPIKYEKLYVEMGLKPCKGILLYGPPGCGKTLIAKAIASTLFEGDNSDPDSFIYVKGGEALESLVGAAERKLKEMFESCRRYFHRTKRRAVLFIDEAEAILKKRGSGISSDATDTIVASFLAEMDGFEEGTPFVILATNLANSLDEAVTREGRIDLKVGVNRPNQKDSEEIFGIYLSKMKIADSSVKEMSELASTAIFSTSLSNKISGALIAEIVNSAGKAAIQRKIADPKKTKLGITLEDITSVVDSKIEKYAEASI